MFKKIIIIGVICTVLGGASYAFFRWQKNQKEAAPEEVDISQILTQKSVQNMSELTTTPSSQTMKIPTPETQKPENAPGISKNLNLKMDFYTQAPFENWDYPWQEACEEASVLLVANTYYQHHWTRAQFNDEILKMVDWEKKYFGSYEHTSVDQTAEMLKKYLQLEAQIHENPTYEDVKKILDKGHLIVMTFAGKKIGNPFYKNGGPNYHAMVIKGYKEGEKLITQDVGTKRGENYVYTWKALQNALHDYADPIETGAKRMIEVFPPRARHTRKITSLPGSKAARLARRDERAYREYVSEKQQSQAGWMCLSGREVIFQVCL